MIIFIVAYVLSAIIVLWMNKLLIAEMKITKVWFDFFNLPRPLKRKHIAYEWAMGTFTALCPFLNMVLALFVAIGAIWAAASTNNTWARFIKWLNQPYPYDNEHDPK